MDTKPIDKAEPVALKLRVTLEDLQRVCDAAAWTARRVAKPTIYDRPWTADGHVWACSGRVLVRVPAWMLPGVENGKTPASLLALPWGDCVAHAQPWTWQVLPEVAAASMTTCKVCEGRKRVQPCHFCAAWKELSEHCLYCRNSRWLPDSKGAGAAVGCTRCEGTGEVEWDDVVELKPAKRQKAVCRANGGGVYLKGADVRLVRTLPGPLKVRYPDHGYQAQVAVSFAGGAGEAWVKVVE